MQRDTSVYRRGTVYHVGIKAPAALRAAGLYKTQWAHRGSLGTSDVREANTKAAALRAEWLRRFETELRSLHPETVEVLSPELAETITQRIRAGILAADDAQRFDTARLLQWLQLCEYLFPRLHVFGARKTPEYLKDDPKRPAWAGMSAAQLTRLAEIHERMGQMLTTAVASGNLAWAHGYADAETRQLGFTVNWSRPENRLALVSILRVVTSAWLDRGRRDRGQIIETPATPELVAAQVPVSPPPEPVGRTLADVFPLWRDKLPNRPRKTVDAYQSAADCWAELMGSPALADVTREAGLRFETLLLRRAETEGTSTKTAQNILGRVKTLFRVALDLEWIQRDPMQGRSIQADPSDREPFTPADLCRLFDSPVFSSYSLPPATRAGLDAAYWVPLLGAFHGARISELCQLTPADVLDTPAGLVIRITTQSDERARVKTRAGHRQIPLHPELIRLGFRDYWTAIKEAGASSLWPAVVWSELNGAGGQFSKWFGAFKSAQGFSRSHTFHSFRHSVRSRLTALGAHEAHIDALLGHDGKHAGEGRRTYTRLTPDDIRPTLERLDYPGLSLPRVFKVPAWTPAVAARPRKNSSASR